jgi:hypothetical protein
MALDIEDLESGYAVAIVDGAAAPAGLLCLAVSVSTARGSRRPSRTEAVPVRLV